MKLLKEKRYRLAKRYGYHRLSLLSIHQIKDISPPLQEMERSDDDN
jgi:hypothetical protein